MTCRTPKSHRRCLKVLVRSKSKKKIQCDFYFLNYMKMFCDWFLLLNWRFNTNLTVGLRCSCPVTIATCSCQSHTPSHTQLHAHTHTHTHTHLVTHTELHTVTHTHTHTHSHRHRGTHVTVTHMFYLHTVFHDVRRLPTIISELTSAHRWYHSDVRFSLHRSL